MSDHGTCPSCGADLKYAPGIGPFCPSKNCDVMDGPDIWPDKPKVSKPITDHADLIAQLEFNAIGTGDELPVRAAGAIRSLMNDVRELKANLDRPEATVSRLIAERDRARHERTAAESSMMEQSLRAEKAEAERDEALRHVEQLQDKLDPEHSCACCYDRADTICGHHSPMLAKAEAERDEARALLREIPKCVVIWKDNPETRSVRAHIDALLAKTEGTT